ncbi:MAG: hypothetical protein A2289_17730 [Deltaproteobacteria bacterium RIFOXYA12_FULL_58_15]|nr:MAG: hypothetical protein A2289_17730 [Deltaproteobacteria bacterium RIFOXYA12_FULL_58_15]OGR14899.1 MAG: hypothetical protein A2341_18445 [Deltaproteobacteria bacterium RIFOXYB12_FULL_58_9]
MLSYQGAANGKTKSSAYVNFNNGAVEGAWQLAEFLHEAVRGKRRSDAFGQELLDRRAADDVLRIVLTALNLQDDGVAPSVAAMHKAIDQIGDNRDVIGVSVDELHKALDDLHITELNPGLGIWA